MRKLRFSLSPLRDNYLSYCSVYCSHFVTSLSLSGCDDQKNQAAEMRKKRKTKPQGAKPVCPVPSPKLAPRK